MKSLKMVTTRQAIRRSLFDKFFQRFNGGTAPKDLPSRRERRNAARAFAAGQWRAESIMRGQAK